MGHGLTHGYKLSSVLKGLCACNMVMFYVNVLFVLCTVVLVKYYCVGVGSRTVQLKCIVELTHIFIKETVLFDQDLSGDCSTQCSISYLKLYNNF